MLLSLESSLASSFRAGFSETERPILLQRLHGLLEILGFSIALEDIRILL